ncbi:MAG TPA: Uma2 family endonuclease [Candidatus Ozemobacteraceae bacterium]|nr:Uma2 family endonuclease [Candidatus Ozemobacteraceae bacterium]
MSHPLQTTGRKFTYADYLASPENERWEIIDGESFKMAPIPGSAHQEISAKLVDLLRAFFRDRPGRVIQAPVDVRLPKPRESVERTTTVVHPDILVVCDEEKIDERGLKGAPDLIIEILSSAAASHDRIRKRDIYEKHGVKEFWLVSPGDRSVTIFRLTPNGAFRPPEIKDCDRLKVKVSIFPGLAIDFSEVLPPRPKRK